MLHVFSHTLQILATLRGHTTFFTVISGWWLSAIGPTLVAMYHSSFLAPSSSPWDKNCHNSNNSCRWERSKQAGCVPDRNEKYLKAPTKTKHYSSLSPQQRYLVVWRTEKQFSTYPARRFMCSACRNGITGGGSHIDDSDVCDVLSRWRTGWRTHGTMPRRGGWSCTSQWASWPLGCSLCWLSLRCPQWPTMSTGGSSASYRYTHTYTQQRQWCAEERVFIPLGQKTGGTNAERWLRTPWQLTRSQMHAMSPGRSHGLTHTDAVTPSVCSCPRFGIKLGLWRSHQECSDSVAHFLSVPLSSSLLRVPLPCSPFLMDSQSACAAFSPFIFPVKLIPWPSD